MRRAVAATRPPPDLATDAGRIEEAIRIAETHWRRECRRRHGGWSWWIDEGEVWGAIHEAAIRAARRFDPEHGAAFRSWVLALVRGATLECYRRQDWLFRRDRHIVRRLEAAGEPIPDALLPPRSFEDLVLVGDGENEDLPLSDTLVDPGADTPAEARRRLVAEALGRAVARLPANERIVIVRYYWLDQTLKEIGREIGRCEARVGQLKDQAIARLREMLDEAALPL